MINETILEFIDRTICNIRTDRRIADLSVNLSPYDVRILPPVREAIGRNAIHQVVCNS